MEHLSFAHRPTVVAEPAPAPARPGRFGGVVDACRRGYRRIPECWTYIAGLFLGSKLVFTLLGLLVIHVYGMSPSAPASNLNARFDADKLAVSNHDWLSMWYAWDSFLYLKLVHGPQDWQYAFAPGYPTVAKLVVSVTGLPAAAALLLVSNIAFVAVLYYAYRLGQQLLGDAESARRVARYVLLLPAAFLFQAALTESLYLALVLACFYHAERRNWLIVGVLGFVMAGTRSVGFTVAIPLILILLQQGSYRLQWTSLRQHPRVGWPLLLVPAGWLSFMAYCYVRTGDWFRYSHQQLKGWGLTFQDPVTTLWQGLTSPQEATVDQALFAVVFIALAAAAAVQRLKPAYVVYILLSVAMPLLVGPIGLRSLIRYLVVAFPVCLLFAVWGRRRDVDAFLTAGLAMLQGVLWVTWLTSWTSFIV